MGLHRTFSTLLLGSLALSAQLSWGQDQGKTIVMQGNAQGAMACVACHNADGSGQAAAGFPRLAGLPAPYLVQQMQAFANGKRQNAIMLPIASALSDAEKIAVADYFSTLPTVAGAPAPGADQALLNEGKALAIDGNWDKDMPACVACHGPGAAGVGDSFPGIAGQSALYISNQLKAWKNGQRSGDPNALMKTVADKLNDREIEAVSSYLASLPIKP